METAEFETRDLEKDQKLKTYELTGICLWDLFTLSYQWFSIRKKGLSKTSRIMTTCGFSALFSHARLQGG